MIAVAPPLAGIQVIVLDAGVPGLYTAHVLARFGATVTIVEPAGGDPVRRLAPFPVDRPDREADGYVGLHLNTQPQWRALCEFRDRAAFCN